MVKNKHKNSTKLYLLLTIAFISVFAFAQYAFGQTITLDNEDSYYEFELGEKSTTIDNNNNIENKNEEFAYGIIERTDVIIFVVCILIIAIEILIILKSKNRIKK